MGAKTHFPARLWNDMYDYLQARSQEENRSMNAMLNHILKEDKRRHTRKRSKITVISPSSQNALQR